MANNKFIPTIKVKDLKLQFDFHKGNRGLNDYIQIQLFACNYIGFTFRIFGFGFTLRLRLYVAK